MKKRIIAGVTASAALLVATVAGCSGGLGGTTTIRVPAPVTVTATPTPAKSAPVTKTATPAPVNVNQNNYNNAGGGGGAGGGAGGGSGGSNGGSNGGSGGNGSNGGGGGGGGGGASGDQCGFVKIPVPCTSTPTPAAATPTSGNCGCAAPTDFAWNLMQTYYGYLGGGEFQQAWNMQTPAFQAANGGYASWAAGYAHTGMNHVYLISEPNPNTVNLSLVARDTTTQEFQTFDCTYTVDTSSSLIQTGSCTLVSTQ